MTRRRTIAAAVLVAGIALAVLAAAAVSALGARAELTAARGAVGDARRALADVDTAAASAAFERAGTRFGAGQARLETLPVRAVALVPGVRAPRRSARRSRARRCHPPDGHRRRAGRGRRPRRHRRARRTARGGGGVRAPRRGDPLGAHRRAGWPAGRRRRAAHRRGGAGRHRPTLGADHPGRRRPGRVDRAVGGGDRDGAHRGGAGRPAAGVPGRGRAAPLLPRGAEPRELRGTGGLIGAWGALTVDGGRIDISAFQSIGTLTDAAPDDLPPPSADFAARYARFSAGIHGSNINMTPDVPTAATATETLYQAATGQPLDGTILADPLFLQALLDVVGPTEVPEAGTITAENVVAFVTRDQYEALEAAPDRKELLGEVAGAVLGRFLAGDTDPAAAVSAVGGAVGDGRLVLHATSPDVQAAFAVAGVDRALADPDGGDYLAVVGNNAAANKLDTLMRQEVTYEARLQSDGSVQRRLTLTVTNTAPNAGLHQTVLGPNVEDLVAGENRTYWSVYCAPGCLLDEFERDGEPADVTSERERDRPVFSTTITLASGESETLEYRWTIPDAWSLDAGYNLTVDGQPTLMDGSTTVRVRPGDRVGAVTAAPPLTTLEGTATWQGSPSDHVTLHADVEPPTRSLRRRIADFLTRPLLEWAASSSNAVPVGAGVGQHGDVGALTRSPLVVFICAVRSKLQSSSRRPRVADGR